MAYTFLGNENLIIRSFALIEDSGRVNGGKKIRERRGFLII